MRAYRFRLATVARIRAVEERVARDALMTALRDVRGAREAERDVYRALADLPAPSGVISVDDVLFAGDQAQRFHEALVARRDHRAACVEVSETARASWKDASQRASVLERLDADARARWRLASQRDEMAELDDLMTARFEQRSVLS